MASSSSSSSAPESRRLRLQQSRPRLLPLSLACLGHFAAPTHQAPASDMFVDVDALPKSESLADGFRVSLVRPPHEAANSGQKMLVNVSSMDLLEADEVAVLDAYDDLFEKYSLFCNGRWLGAQVLQDSQDLMYMQHIVFMKKPDVIIETGTYKGGLTYFFASLLEWTDPSKAAQIVSVDVHHPDLVYAANWFCPVCADCIRPYETDVWARRVRFVQGHADSESVYHEILNHMYDTSAMRFVEPSSGAVLSQKEVEGRGGLGPTVRLEVDPSKTILVNLDANHEFEGLLKELLFYAPLVTENSYLIVQDTKLDKIWGSPGPTAALQRFLAISPEGEFVLEPELKFHAYSQHTYLRRAKTTVPYTFFWEKMLALSSNLS